MYISAVFGSYVLKILYAMRVGMSNSLVRRGRRTGDELKGGTVCGPEDVFSTCS
jgi:hypothetical protein